MAFLGGIKEECLNDLELFQKNIKKGAVVVADNIGVFETSMRDYLEYVRNSGLYNSKVLETELEFNRSIKDATELVLRLFERKVGRTYAAIRHYKILAITV